jgi:uncharacterized protein
MGRSVIVERDVMVPMRDGVRLAADVYRPAENGRYPVLVYRTPYGTSNGINVASRILNPLDAVLRGYTVVVQDVRGRFKSEGQWQPFANEAGDGYDTVEWAAIQPWSSGKIGIYGASYVGVTAMHAAIAAPPHLQACMVQALASNPHNCWTYSGGAFELGFNLFWIAGPFWGLAWDTLRRLHLSDEEIARAQKGLAEITADAWGTCRRLPLIDLPALKTSAPYWQEWLAHPAYDQYWKALDPIAKGARITVPVLNIAGWFDIFLRGSLEFHEFLESHSDDHARKSHRFILGPWEHVSHLNLMPSAAGQWEFGPEAISGPRLLTDLTLEFFDQCLKGAARLSEAASKIRYFMMGENRWQESPSWPPPHTPTNFYLHSGGAANSRGGNGFLTTDGPGAEPPDSYVYDPANPVPTVGGRALFYHPALGPTGVADQATVEERQDVLVYSSPRLNRPFRIAGPVTVTLFAATSGVDTDFTAKLVDVQPDGFCANIAEGIIRARYRNSPAREELLEPGQIYELTIDLWSVAHTFQVSHIVRLEISSSNFPRYDRNLNGVVSPALGRAHDIHVVTQQVFHDIKHPSHLTLPAVASRP